MLNTPSDSLEPSLQERNQRTLYQHDSLDSPKHQTTIIQMRKGGETTLVNIITNESEVIIEDFEQFKTGDENKCRPSTSNLLDYDAFVT